MAIREEAQCIYTFNLKKSLVPFIRNLRRVLLADLAGDMRLHNAYIHGKVASQSSVKDGAEIHLSVLDESTDLWLPVILKGDAAKQYPRGYSTTGYELYMHKAQIICKHELEWSQSSRYSVTVTGRDGEKIWLFKKTKGRPSKLSIGIENSRANSDGVPDPGDPPRDDSVSVTDEGDAGMERADAASTSGLSGSAQEDIISGLEMEGNIVEEVVYDSPPGEVMDINIAQNVLVQTSKKQTSDTQMSKEDCVAAMTARFLKLPLASLTGDKERATKEAEGEDKGSDDDVVLMEGPASNDAMSAKEALAKSKSAAKVQKPSPQGEHRVGVKRPSPRRADSDLEVEQSNPQWGKNKSPVKKQMVKRPSPQTGHGQGTRQPAPRHRHDSELNSDDSEHSNLQRGATTAVKDKSSVKKQNPSQTGRLGQGTKRSAPRHYHDSELNSDGSEQSDGKDPLWGPKRKKVVGETGRAYDYMRIGDLKTGDDKKNVFGVVKFFKPIFQTRGPDYCCVLTIVDESSQPTGLKCNLFQRNPERLPQIQCVGDIVCIHRLKIQEYNLEPQGYGQKFTSSICFDGRTTAQVIPRTGSDSYTLTKKEKKRVKELREWSATQGDLAANTRLCKLTDVRSDMYFDLLCQIIGTTNCKDHECIVLSVWDGTQLHLPRKECDYSHYVSVTDHSLRKAAKELATDIIIYESHSAFFHSKPGQLVRLHNVHANPVSGFNSLGDKQVYTELCIHRGTQSGSGVSGISVLPEEDVDCVGLKAQLKRALERNSTTSQQKGAEASKQPTERKLLPKSTTIALHPGVVFTRISDILSHSQVPYKFRCRAKVVCVSPQCIEDFTQIRCPVCHHRVAMPRSQAEMNSIVDNPCPKCSSNGSKTGGKVSNLSLSYIFKLLLGDESGFMHAFVADEDAEKFLPDLPPRNFYLEQDQRRKLLDRLYYLTGGKDPFVKQAHGTCLDKFRPWMECCIKSYHSSTSKQPNQPPPNRRSPPLSTLHKVCFRVFDTILNSEEALSSNSNLDPDDNETRP